MRVYDSTEKRTRSLHLRSSRHWATRTRCCSVPSNPFLSVAPVLAVSGVRLAIERFTGTRIAVSPIVGGKALRGPAAKMLAELGHDVSALGVARSYRKLCDVFVVDEADRDLAPEIEALGMDVVVTDTVMKDDADKVRLAEQVCRIAGLTI